MRANFTYTRESAPSLLRYSELKTFPQVYHDGFNAFWDQTKIEYAPEERFSRQQKKNLAKKSKAANVKTEVLYSATTLSLSDESKLTMN